MHLPTYDNLEVGDAGGSKVQLDVHNVFVSTTPLLFTQCLTKNYTLTVGASEQRDSCLVVQRSSFARTAEFWCSKFLRVAP